MRNVFLVSATLVAAVLAVVPGCGGSVSSLGPGPGPGSDGGTPPGTPGVPAEHRPTALACASHAGSGVPCTDDAECNSDTPGASPNHCLQGRCTPDQCLSDADCPNGTLCACVDATGAGGYPGPQVGNTCSPTGCRVDSDCGPGGYCSPNPTGPCASYGAQGYSCHGPGDECTNDSDCGSASGTGFPYCAYDPTVGVWRCGFSHCAG